MQVVTVWSRSFFWISANVSLQLSAWNLFQVGGRQAGKNWRLSHVVNFQCRDLRQVTGMKNSLNESAYILCNTLAVYCRQTGSLIPTRIQKYHPSHIPVNECVVVPSPKLLSTSHTQFIIDFTKQVLNWHFEYS